MTDDQSRLISRASRVGSIDRDALWNALPPNLTDEGRDRLADAVLALVRPVEGVVLSPEEAALAGATKPSDVLPNAEGGTLDVVCTLEIVDPEQLYAHLRAKHPGVVPL